MTAEKRKQGRTSDAATCRRREGDLCYVTDEMAGFRRKRWGRGFSYFDPEGRRIGDKKTLKRIKGLVIPPAWRDVWICTHRKGHIQATGRDAKGRKQYIYHPRWEEVRNRNKFDRLLDFGRYLPRIRRQVDADLRKRNLSWRKVVALVAALLDTAKIRVGNPEYRRGNRSYGLTTLRERHVAVSGSTIHIEFKGKRGKQQQVEVTDRRLARQVSRCQELPGQGLFQYIDGEGKRQPIRSDDVNTYLREVTGEDFTAKDFRTWWGTVLMAEELAALSETEPELPREKAVIEAVNRVAGTLGNTRAVCRKYYIHPGIIEAFEKGELEAAFEAAVPERGEETELLGSGERAVMQLLSRE